MLGDISFTFAVDGSEVSGSPPGLVPLAVAVLERSPPSLRSAATTVYVAVQSIDCPGPSAPVPGQVMPDRAP